MDPNPRQMVHKLFRDALARMSANKWLALALVLIVPGGFVVPFCYGVYAALRLRAPAERARR